MIRAAIDHQADVLAVDNDDDDNLYYNNTSSMSADFVNQQFVTERVNFSLQAWRTTLGTLITNSSRSVVSWRQKPSRQHPPSCLMCCKASALSEAVHTAECVETAEPEAAPELEAETAMMTGPGIHEAN